MPGSRRGEKSDSLQPGPSSVEGLVGNSLRVTLHKLSNPQKTSPEETSPQVSFTWGDFEQEWRRPFLHLEAERRARKDWTGNQQWPSSWNQWALKTLSFAFLNDSWLHDAYWCSWASAAGNWWAFYRTPWLKGTQLWEQLISFFSIYTKDVVAQAL